jgi:hypothetical protein
MRLYNETRELLKGTEQWRMFETLLALLSLISGCFAISVVPFIRKDFGERYLGWLNLFFGYTVVANFMFLGTLLMSLSGAFLRHPSSSSPQLMFVFWLAFIGMSLYRRWEITRKNNAGVEWHSMYMGTSLLPLPVSREKIYKFFEPVIVYAVGHFLWAFSGQVGLWLMISAVALYVNNHIVFYNERRALLDMRDAQIEAKYLSAALSGRPANETAGFVVAESSVRLMNQNAGLKDAFVNLSPELGKVLDSPPDLGSPAEGNKQ